MEYNPKKIEKKWQRYWEKNKFYRARDFSKNPKKYILFEFPYPSGEGLHVGHTRSYSAIDAIARKKRMEGYNVLFPIGWDAFGLPAENYAIKTGIHPQKATEKNIANYKRQLKSLGLSLDWSREINTTNPKYYKWTQWIFLKLFEKGLAYQAKIPINWCPACKIGLANEEVVNGACERCKTSVKKKILKQWMLKITAYADRLIDDLKKVDYPARVKTQQIEWIGKSYGAEIDFKVVDSGERIRIFTTRADTLFGATAIVISPEHSLIEKLITKNNKERVINYIKGAKKKSDFEREKLEKEKTGVFTGSYCLNPGNNEKIPIWIGDYVVASYSEGAVMVVPAYDERDYDFAKKFNLPIKKIKLSKTIQKIVSWLEEMGCGKKAVNYKLRDWVFSRQHYWGEPIPIIHCSKCGVVLVSEKDLPIELPYVKKYEPTGTGESPLANIKEWVNCKCPKCKGVAKRETDTMPNWAGSNWYFIRYCDPENDKYLADSKKIKYWLSVDWYNGGMEHTTLHLLYSRFIYKFLFDIKVVPQLEPYQRRTSHGIVLAEDGRKMSKSFGNVINPDDIIKNYGADSLRIYEMFMGPFDQAIAWNTQGIKGVYRFLERAWRLVLGCAKNQKSNPEIIKAIHKLNKKINEDLEMTKFNTIIAAFMEFVNLCAEKKEYVSRDVIERFLILLSPFAPHLTEELWQKIGGKDSIHSQKWPKYNPKLIKEEMITLVIQVNGKVRDKIEVEANISEEKAKGLAVSREKIKNWVLGKKIKKIIFVPGKLINIVV